MQKGRTGNIKLRSPRAALRGCERSPRAVQICFQNSAACPISTVGVAVGTRLLAVSCLGATAEGVDSHLIVVHQVDADGRFHLRPLSGMRYEERTHISTISISPPAGQLFPVLTLADRIGDC